MLLVEIWWQENKNKLAEWKAFIDTMGHKSACLKDNFVVEFCSPPNYQDVGKGHKMPYAAQND